MNKSIATMSIIFAIFYSFSLFIIIRNPTPVIELKGISNSLIAEYLVYACPVLCIVSAVVAFSNAKLSLKILLVTSLISMGVGLTTLVITHLPIGIIVLFYIVYFAREMKRLSNKTR
jgi:uncharacterized membrane protein YcfT